MKLKTLFEDETENTFSLVNRWNWKHFSKMKLKTFFEDETENIVLISE